MDIEEIKKDFGDCDWMRAILNGFTVDAILWLINRVEELEKASYQPNVQADEETLCRCGMSNCENCGDGLPALSE